MSPALNETEITYLIHATIYQITDVLGMSGYLLYDAFKQDVKNAFDHDPDKAELILKELRFEEFWDIAREAVQDRKHFYRASSRIEL